MKTARFVLKIVALSLSIAAVACAIVAYWDRLTHVTTCAASKLKAKTKFNSEYDDYEE